MLKKALTMFLAVVMLFACASAGAETIVNAAENRQITIQPAGDNTVPENVSPVTGRDLSAAEVPEGILGMAVSGKYYPVLVQHNGCAGATGNAAPWNGCYADVYYEQPKAQAGYTRLTMLFNDFYPQYVGASRSIRVGHVWLRQEWGAPIVYAGSQEAGNDVDNTSVADAARQLGLYRSENPNAPLEERVLFNALDGYSPSRPWTLYRYRVTSLTNNMNLVWDLHKLSEEVFAKDRTFPNHTWKFTDSLPEEGDRADRIYVMFNKNHAKTGDSSKKDDVYYFNSMLEYDEEKNLYYRYLIDDISHPWNNAILFTELVPTNVDVTKQKEKMDCDIQLYGQGEESEEHAITFSNVIIQFIDVRWPSSDEPYPILTGTGNADYFMGGKHISGVWKRDTYDDRTVFYGPDGQEISLQRGRTLIVQMDYNTRSGGDYARQLKYE